MTHAKRTTKRKVLVSLPEGTARFLTRLAHEEQRDVSEIVSDAIHRQYDGYVIPARILPEASLVSA